MIPSLPMPMFQFWRVITWHETAYRKTPGKTLLSHNFLRVLPLEIWCISRNSFASKMNGETCENLLNLDYVYILYIYNIYIKYEILWSHHRAPVRKMSHEAGRFGELQQRVLQRELHATKPSWSTHLSNLQSFLFQLSHQLLHLTQLVYGSVVKKINHMAIQFCAIETSHCWNVDVSSRNSAANTVGMWDMRICFWEFGPFCHFISGFSSS